MTTKILKSTTRGQITLPVEWRSHFSTSNYIAELHEGSLVIKPLELSKEAVLFNAETDNDGKGIEVEEMIALLKELK